MNRQIQVVRFASSTRSFVHEEQSLAELSPGQILVRVQCCTICGSDLHTYQGRRSAPDSCILGHEIVGTVVGWADQEPPQDYYGNPLHHGQRITWSIIANCGECFFCKQGLFQKCERLFKYGHQPASEGAPTGGLCDYCLLVPGTHVFPVPESLPDEVAAPASCATATVSAAMRLACETHAVSGARVVVLGMGMLGLTAAAMIKVDRAQKIIAIDGNEDRLKLSEEFGVSKTICANQQSEDVAKAIAKETADRGADIVLDFAGSIESVHMALENVRVGGCVLLAGSVFPTGMIDVDPEQIVRKMLTIRGLHNYLPIDLGEGLSFLEQNHTMFPFNQLVSQTFSLEQTTQAFEFALSHKPIRVAICPKESDPSRRR